jgi:hypothetical protein
MRAPSTWTAARASGTRSPQVMTAREAVWTTLGGVPTHYARPPIAPYGTRGLPRSFHSSRALHETLEAAFRELWELFPEGRAEVIVTAGAHVDRPGTHGRGAAFDLDALFWKDRAFITREFSAAPAFYLGIEAVLRRHWGTVLGYLFDAAHADHLHVELGRPVGLARQLRSDTVFVQGVCRHVFGLTLALDGRWGPQTAGALATAQGELGLSGPLESPAAWRDLLGAIARRALGAPVPSVTPLDRLRSLHELVATELGDSPSRKRIEAAVNVFAGEPEIEAVLARYRG